MIARTLGTPLIPWQQHVVDVASERRPDGSYEYPVVVVSVPRQTGKTTLIRAVGTYRALVNRRDVYYTAQTGKDARERWDDLVKIVQVTPAFRNHYRLMRRGGSERIVFDELAGFHVFAPTAESLHGYTPPTVFIDEAFSLSGAAGELLMGAIGPAQLTIRDRQLWIVSTAGTAESTFLHDWIDRAVEGTPRVAGFVWGARDDQDPYNADDIAAFHPGIGFELNHKVLTPADVLEQADRNGRAEYERAYANRRTITTAHLIPADTWRALADPHLAQPAHDELVLAYEVAHDRQSSAIVAGWLSGDRPAAKIVQAGPGVGWLADAVDALDKAWRPRELVAVDNGPALEVTEELRRRGVTIRAMGEREFATATGAFLTRVDEATLTHDGDALLEESVTGLVTRPAVSDGVAFSRRHSTGDSSPGIAAAIALDVAAETDRATVPVFDFGGAA